MNRIALKSTAGDIGAKERGFSLVSSLLGLPSGRWRLKLGGSYRENWIIDT
jgi:hypothetical protein